MQIGEFAIPDGEIEWRFVRASGPGGQNVNKVATAVELRFDLYRNRSLPVDVRERLAALAGRRVSREGVLLIQARRLRTQERNRQDALERLAILVRRAAERPKPHRPTRPTAASRRRRLETKQRRGRLKSLRRERPEEEG